MFGWLRNWLYVHVQVKSPLNEQHSQMAMKMLIDCPKCHAGDVALCWQAIVFYKTGYFSIPFILASIFVAICFTDLAELIDKFKNS